MSSIDLFKRSILPTRPTQRRQEACKRCMLLQVRDVVQGFDELQLSVDPRSFSAFPRYYEHLLVGDVIVTPSDFACV